MCLFTNFCKDHKFLLHKSVHLISQVAFYSGHLESCHDNSSSLIWLKCAGIQRRRKERDK